MTGGEPARNRNEFSVTRRRGPIPADGWIAQSSGTWVRYSDGSVELRGPWTGVMGEPLPEWLDRVVAPLLRDFQLPTPIDVVVGYGTNHRGDDVLWIQEPQDPGPCGFQITEEMRGDHLIVELADRLQEQFFLETAQAWGQPRPPCPGHPHPLYASTRDGGPYWFCPVTHSPVAAIGRLDFSAPS